MKPRNRKSWTEHLKQEAVSFEIDLAPMLALMVTLIPILLLSSVFVKVMVIDSPLPQVVAQAIKEDRENKKPEVRITLSVSGKSGFNVIVTDRGKNKTTKIPLKDKQLDFDKLHETMVSVKQEYPRTFKLEMFPEGHVSYKDLIKVMDSVRRTNENDPKLFIHDSKTNKDVENQLMFPDVVFANVVEG